MEEHLVLLFTGGDPLPAGTAALLPADAFVIGADSGVEHALDAGRRVDLAVGDFDSVQPEALARVEGEIERHPMAKDETDLELGLAAALKRGSTRVVVAGGYGGRVDHFLANALLLASPRFASMRIEAHVGTSRINVVRTHVEVDGQLGSLLSLLAVGGSAKGVRTEGLLYPLRGERLDEGSTRGVSNVFVQSRASVSLETGTLLVVQPGYGGTT